MGKGKSANPAEAHRKRNLIWFLHAAHPVPRQGPAKERTQKGMFPPVERVSPTLTRPQTVEQDRQAEEP